MNKLYLPLLLVLLALGSCSKDSDPEPDKDSEPEIYLKSVTSYMTPYQNGGLVTQARFKWGSETYDLKGLLIKKEYRSLPRPTEEHNPLRWETYTYENDLLKSQIFHYTPNHLHSDGIDSRHEYTYTSGKLSAMDIYNQAGLFMTITYEYDGGEKPARMEITYHRTDVPTDTRYLYTNTYDGKENLIKQELRVGDFYVETRYWEYDAKENLTKEYFTISWGETIGETVISQLIEYTYDAKGRIAEREFSTQGENDFQKWVYHYDDSSQEHPGQLKSIDVHKETAQNSRIYEQAGVINYEYEYGIR